MSLTIKEIAERLAVTQHTVLAWIRSGELKAMDVSRTRGGKPQWRVTPEALEAFELARTATPTPPRRRRRKKPDVVEFF